MAAHADLAWTYLKDGKDYVLPAELTEGMPLPTPELTEDGTRQATRPIYALAALIAPGEKSAPMDGDEDRTLLGAIELEQRQYINIDAPANADVPRMHSTNALYFISSEPDPMQSDPIVSVFKMQVESDRSGPNIFLPENFRNWALRDAIPTAVPFEETEQLTSHLSQLATKGKFDAAVPQHVGSE
jgi:hypothetical protein